MLLGPRVLLWVLVTANQKLQSAQQPQHIPSETRNIHVATGKCALAAEIGDIFRYAIGPSLISLEVR